MEESEIEYLLSTAESKGGELPAEIPKIDTKDWVKRGKTAASIDNYCKEHTSADDDPETTALEICAKIRELLSKNDREHCKIEYVNDIFVGCKRYRNLYPDGWTADTAARILGKVFAARTKEEAAADRQARSNELAEAAAAAYTPQPATGRLNTAGEVAEAVTRSQKYYIGSDGLTAYFVPERLREVWYIHTHAAKIKESDGYMWYDGVEWHEDERGHELSGAMLKNAETVAAELCDEWAVATGAAGPHAAYDGIRKMLLKTAPRDITGMRQEPTISTAAVYGKGLTCIDGVLIVDGEGIHITQHDPDRDVWLGSVPVSTRDLLSGLESMMTLEEVANHFPAAVASLRACDDPNNPNKITLMATMAGVAIYYTMPQHIPLDAWYYLWDGQTGGTGKSTHLKHYMRFFGKYVGTVGWRVFTGENEQNGELYGKIGAYCDEAGIADIRSIERLKSYTSGGWTEKRLYQDPIGIPQPLLLISLANHPPALSPIANTRPIQERIQPCEFTQKLRGTRTEFPCSDDEYNRFLFNAGVWVCLRLMKAGGKVCKADLPYYIAPEAVATVTTRVPWKDTLMDIGTWRAGAEEPLKEVLAALRYELRNRGWEPEDFTSAPELKNIEKFRAALDGFGMPKRDEYGHVIKGRYETLRVVRKRGESGKESKWWLKNFSLSTHAQKGREQLTSTITPAPEEKTEPEPLPPATPEKSPQQAQTAEREVVVYDTPPAPPEPADGL